MTHPQIRSVVLLVNAKVRVSQTTENGERSIHATLPYLHHAKVFVGNQRVTETVSGDAFKHAGDAGGPDNTCLLLGHGFEKPLADIRAGTLEIHKRNYEIELQATLPFEGPSWMDAAAKALKNRVTRGLSLRIRCAGRRRALAATTGRKPRGPCHLNQSIPPGAMPGRARCLLDRRPTAPLIHSARCCLPAWRPT